MVFAHNEDREHPKSRDHRHRSSARSTGAYRDWVQWSVEVGRMYWDNESTFVWHYILVRNLSDEEIDGDWEFNHHVMKEDFTWADDDTTFGIEAIDLEEDNPGTTWAKSGCSEVYLPDNNNDLGRYQITAYTEVTLRHGNDELTRNATKKRSIKSVWFRRL